QRLEAVQEGLLIRGLELDPRLSTSGDFTVPGGVSAMREIIARGVKFDAVVGANDNMALGAMQVLQEHGFAVPRNIVVAGFDDVTVARFGNPSLTTIRQPLRRLAAIAVECILDCIAGRPTFSIKS